MKKDAVIKVQNCYSWLYTENQEVRSVLWERLRFRERNYFHSRLYKQKIWDGYTEFFKLMSGRFLTGLLPEVEAALKYLKIDYVLDDQRNGVDFRFSQIDDQFLNQWLPEGVEPLTLYDYQVGLANAAIQYKRGVVQAPTACHGKGQPILLHNGTTKLIENIRIGDKLMGPDGKPRTVIQLHSGLDELYRIIPKHGGNSFVVNSQHILTLVRTKSGNRFPSEEGGKIVDVPVDEYLSWNKWNKHLHKLFRTGVEFERQELPLHPYFLGMMLGDGSMYDVPRITTINEEIVRKAATEAKRRNLSLNDISSKERVPTYSLVGNGGRWNENPISKSLKDLELWGCKCHDKFIPYIYQVASKEQRLQLLAGLLDTDGCCSKGTGYDFVSKSKELAQGLCFVARSVGCSASVSPCKKKSQNGTEGNYWRVYISGNVKIPHKLTYKSPNRKSNKDPLRTGFTIEEMGRGQYYGFTLEEEPHYLLDDFTVTHNSGKTNIMISILKALPQNCPTLILANRKSLVQQNYEEMMQWGFDNVGRLYDKYKEPNIFTCATVQSLHKMEKVLPKIRALVVDEIHENMSKKPKQFFNKMSSCSVRIAVSATPFKFGGKDKCQKWTVKGYFGPVLEAEEIGGVLTTKKLQDRDILAKSRCRFYPIHEPELKYEIYLDAVTRGIAENWGFHEIVTRLAKKLPGRTLILVDRIAHGDALAGMIPGALWVQGKDDIDTRMFVIDKLKHSKEKTIAIATQQIFNAGINVKCHSVINAAGGQADHQIVQRVGRGLRTADDKDILDYYDFMFFNNDYLLDHSNKRVRILEDEGHEVIIHDQVDF